MSEFDGQGAVVTGGASGIGLITALRLAARGARVVVGDLRVADESAGQLLNAGIEFVCCDVRREEDVRALVQRTATLAGRLDLLVNNAGVGLVKPITEVSEAEWDACLDTNLKGAFFGCKHAIRAMQQSGRGGAIVNVASNAGLLPRAHDPVYSISKGALISLTKSLALCHAPDKIRINAVCPGPVCRTGMMEADLASADDRPAMERTFIEASPLARAYARMISPEEVADAILYLASEAAAMVTGTAIAIDGGKSLGVPPSPR